MTSSSGLWSFSESSRAAAHPSGGRPSPAGVAGSTKSEDETGGRHQSSNTASDQQPAVSRLRNANHDHDGFRKAASWRNAGSSCWARRDTQGSECSGATRPRRTADLGRAKPHQEAAHWSLRGGPPGGRGGCHLDGRPRAAPGPKRCGPVHGRPVHAAGHRDGHGGGAGGGTLPRLLRGGILCPARLRAGSRRGRSRIDRRAGLRLRLRTGQPRRRARPDPGRRAGVPDRDRLLPHPFGPR